MTKTKNIELWESVAETNPKYTKSFDRRGFKGVSVNPTWLYKKMTEIFGPVGMGWGWEIKEEQVLDGHFINEQTRARIHCVRVYVWYKQGEEKYHTPCQFGQTTLVGINKNGLFTDEEAPKKSVTDAVTKCLSTLGFCADIFMGQYDDVKYVGDINQKYGVEAKPATQLNVDDDKLVQVALAAQPDNDFVKSVADKFKQYGKLSDKQRAALEKTVAQNTTKSPKEINRQPDMPESPPVESYDDLNDDLPF